DQYGHNSQVVDGIMVTRGTTIPYNKTGRWDWISSGERWLSGMGDLSTFYGGFDLGREFFGSTLTHGDYHSVEITFDPGLQTNCAVYRRDLGYQYSGTGIFYGAAYDISDSLNPRRVNIVFAEDHNIKPADLIWNPDTTGLGGREYLFIMDSDYDPVTAGGYNDTNFGPDADVVWGGWTRVKPGYSFLQEPADLYLYLDKAVGQGDVFQFTPQWTNADTLPHTFQLYQNYPNPFNLVTNIQFYLIRAARVKLEIYNVLGQKVRTLMNGEMEAGEHRLQWDGRNDAGNTQGSGIYFFRISIGDFVKTRKMILLR
ncbi:MAG: FlgD immunoglobulin-like domain containing protein, partial [Calditrichia bacterium]